jgi:hypothetical protein
VIGDRCVECCRLLVGERRAPGIAVAGSAATGTSTRRSGRFGGKRRPTRGAGKERMRLPMGSPGAGCKYKSWQVGPVRHKRFLEID